MNIGLYQSASSLTALEKWQTAVAQNITSSQSPGFKKRGVGFASEAMGQTYPDAKGSDGQPMQFPTARMSINYKAGEMTPTGSNLDMAVQGEGFLVVQKEDGSKVYTRNGSLTVNKDRQLVATSGEPIMTESGTPITMLPQEGSLIINRDGTVYQGDTLLGKFQVVNFDNLSELTPVMGGFAAPAGVEAKPVDKPNILQGYSEGSNVTATHEMVDLVTIARAYEANQKVIQNTDGMLQKALDKLG
jgi:flagellar basal body rod protein FlgG